MSQANETREVAIDAGVEPMNDAERRQLYRELRTQLSLLLAGETDFIAAMATVVCELHHAFPYFDWTGFYRVTEKEMLVIGPYQGAHGCLRIPFSRGVCGAAARSKATQRVDRVSERADHIACSSSTQSEIVVPLLAPAGHVIAVLDVDSNREAAFSAVDQEELEALCKELALRFAHSDARS